jgi:general secretion pathway protein D
MLKKIMVFLLIFVFMFYSGNFVQAQQAGGNAPAVAGNSPLIKFISASGKMVPDVETNSVMVVDYPSNIANIDDYLKMADVPVPQVLIEAKIVEVDLNKENALGVNWNTVAEGLYRHYGNSVLYNSNPNNLLGTVTASQAPQVNVPTYDANGNLVSNTVQTLATSLIGPLWTSSDANGNQLSSLQAVTAQMQNNFAMGIFNNGISIDAVLKMLATETKTNILSSPQLTTTNNRRAKIDVVTSTPYVSGVSPNPTTNSLGVTTYAPTYTFSQIDEGVSMEVTPTINADKSITLNLFPQVKEIIGSVSTPPAPGTTLPIVQPIVDVRSTQTKVTVQSGQTLVIAGLMKEKITNVATKFPLLGDLPVVGSFFRSNDKTKVKTELLIFVSPKIITSGVVAGMSKKSMQLARGDDSDADKRVVSSSKKAPSSSGQDEQDLRRVMARLDTLQSKMKDVTDNRKSLQAEIDKANNNN